MQHMVVQPHREFKMLGGTKRSQAAVMVLFPGEFCSSEDIEDISSDQWFYIISGSGLAKVEASDIKITKGSMLLVEAGERYQIISTTEQLSILNFFVPQLNK